MQGKNRHILNLLQETLDYPDGIIRDIVKDLSKNNREYKEKIYINMHASYHGHYRTAICDILKNLIFQSNNLSYQPIVEALPFIQEHSNSNQRFFSMGNKVPIDGVILQALKAPLDVEPCISDIIQIMKSKLNMLHERFENKSNTKVAITSRNNKGWFKINPLDKQVVLPISL